jgi:trans-2,3-dihydro-3-hydroxyanthranilate isomerase
MVQVDVFAARPLEGNPLAVFTDARGLSDAELQALAREMNLSETTFVVPRDPATERDRGVRVRIFTVREELPFAGHPSLGTAAVLRGDSGAPEVVLDLTAGRTPVRFETRPGEPPFAEMLQGAPAFSSRHDRRAVARTIGLREEELDPALPVETVSTGLPIAIVPLRSLGTLQRLRLDWAAAEAYLAGTDAKFMYLVCRETVDPAARLHARMVFYAGEDPATGAAAGCAAAWMVAHGVAASDERVLVEQGLEMERPSRLYVRAVREGDRVTEARVGGHVVEVLRAEVLVPPPSPAARGDGGPGASP